MSLADVRREYAHAALTERDVDPDPIRQFERWMGEVQAAHVSEPTAMTLATASPEGTPSARIVLLKGLDARGFVFYTDYRSHKGQDLEQNPRAALVFYWAELERQVRVTGTVARVTHEESVSYFDTRPLASRLSAWASHQSAVVDSRADLEARAMELAHRYDDATPPPLPSYWGGYRLAPAAIEFWQGRRSRLHDRLRYTREPAGAWRIERLSP